MERVFTEKAPAAIGPYSQAMKVGNLVYTSGQIPIDPKTGNVEATDIAGQTRQVMENLKAVLEAAGSSFDKVIKTTCFLANMSDFAQFNAVYESYFKGGHFHGNQKAIFSFAGACGDCGGNRFRPGVAQQTPESSQQE